MKQSFPFKISSTILFLLSPILAFIYSLQKLNNTWAKNVIWGFVAFFGYTFQITDNYIGDAVRYREKFYSYIGNDISIKDLLTNLFVNTQNVEIVEKALAISVGRFTGDYHILFLVYGLVFGYFFSRNFVYIITKVNYARIKGSRIITLALFFTIPIWNINGFDFWTASHVFLFGILPYIFENKKSRLIIIFLAPLIHFSFYLIVFLFIIFVFIKKYNTPIFYFYCISFFVIGLSPSSFGPLIESYAPEVIAKRSQAYINAEDVTQTGGRIIGLVKIIYSLTLNILFIFLFSKFRNIIVNNSQLNRSFIFTFFIIGIFNVLSVIPSVGRFMLIGQWILLSTIYYFAYHMQNFYSSNQVGYYLKKVSPIILIFCVFEGIRNLFPVLGIGSILSNPFLVHLFVNDDFVIGNVLDIIK